MQRKLTTGVLAAAMFTPALATADELDAVKAELAAMRAELAQIKSGSSDQATADLQAATTAALQDARARINYQTEELAAGHDGKFFLASPDGAFRLDVGGQLQFRYNANFRDNSGEDDSQDGFEFRRAKLDFKGHATQDKKLTFQIKVAGGSSDGVVDLEDVKIGYKLSDDLKATLGQFKLPFAREELISSSRQLGVDRSVTTEFFTLDRSQGLQLDYTGIDNTTIRAALTDGADNGIGSSAFADGSDESDLALTARIDHTVFGDHKKGGRDVVAFGDEVLQIGAAGHLNFDQSGTDNAEFYTWTVDGLYKTGNLSVIASFFGLHVDPDNGIDDNTDDFGLNVGVGYSINEQWQPFVRYNFIDVDGGDEINSISAGVNYFVKGHKAKFTADVVVFFDPLNVDADLFDRFPNNPGGGIGVDSDADDEDGQVALRAQFQLLF